MAHLAPEHRAEEKKKVPSQENIVYLELQLSRHAVQTCQKAKAAVP